MWELPFTFAQPLQSLVGGLVAAAAMLAILVGYRKRVWPLRPVADFYLAKRLSFLEPDARDRFFERTFVFLGCCFLAMSLFSLAIVAGVLKNPPPVPPEEAMERFFDEHHVDAQKRAETREKIRQWRERKPGG